MTLIPAEIREAILARAENCCERCRVENGAQGVRLKSSDVFVPMKTRADWVWADRNGHKAIRISLAIVQVHDLTPSKVEYWNLQALCQKCRDLVVAPAPAAARSRRATAAAGQPDLFAVPASGSVRRPEEQGLPIENDGHEVGTTEEDERRERLTHIEAASKGDAARRKR